MCDRDHRWARGCRGVTSPPPREGGGTAQKAGGPSKTEKKGKRKEEKRERNRRRGSPKKKMRTKWKTPLFSPSYIVLRQASAIIFCFMRRGGFKILPPLGGPVPTYGRD